MWFLTPVNTRVSASLLPRKIAPPAMGYEDDKLEQVKVSELKGHNGNIIYWLSITKVPNWLPLPRRYGPVVGYRQWSIASRIERP